MTNTARTPLEIGAAPPADDPRRPLSVARSDEPTAHHISVAGNTYTILLGGGDTDGRYCLMEMNVPPGGGPPPHRHAFEESFTLLEGEIEFMFRGQASTLRAGSTVNIPSNAPHSFSNKSGGVARMLCICAPAGVEQFFLAVGDPVAGREAPPPRLTREDQEERIRRAEELAPKYHIELLEP
jgi:quercetin dioxygenase-like cupin family protein